MGCFVNSFFVFIVNPIFILKEKRGFVLPIVYSHALQWNGKYFNLRTNFCYFLSQCICIGRILPTYLLQIFCSYAFREWWTLILFLEAFLYIFFSFFQTIFNNCNVKRLKTGSFTWKNIRFLARLGSARLYSVKCFQQPIVNSL